MARRVAELAAVADGSVAIDSGVVALPVARHAAGGVDNGAGVGAADGVSEEAGATPGR